jgi:hypothetical protein
VFPNARPPVVSLAFPGPIDPAGNALAAADGVRRAAARRVAASQRPDAPVARRASHRAERPDRRRVSIPSQRARRLLRRHGQLRDRSQAVRRWPAPGRAWRARRRDRTPARRLLGRRTNLRLRGSRPSRGRGLGARSVSTRAPPGAQGSGALAVARCWPSASAGRPPSARHSARSSRPTTRATIGRWR